MQNDTNNTGDSGPGFQGHFVERIRDMRLEHRYLVNWRVAIVYKDSEGRLSFRGRAFDISLHGLSLHSDFSLPMTDRATVLISIPAPSADVHAKIIEIRSRVVYTVLSGELNAFRTGIQFAEYRGDSEELLKQALEGRVPAPIATPRPGRGWG